MKFALAFLLVLSTVASAQGPAADYAGDAKALDKIVVDNYAYEDHWPGGELPDSPQLAAERAAVHDHDSLLHYAENRIASLADHHAITGSSFKDSWAIITYPPGPANPVTDLGQILVEPGAQPASRLRS